MSGCRVLCRRHLPAVRSRLPAARPGRPDRTAAPQAKALNTKALPLLAMLQFKERQYRKQRRCFSTRKPCLCLRSYTSVLVAHSPELGGRAAAQGSSLSRVVPLRSVAVALATC